MKMNCMDDRGKYQRELKSIRDEFHSSLTRILIKTKNHFVEPPVDCAWGDWSEYSACSVTCGGAGTQTRTRSKAVEASGGGFDCVGPTEETTSCNNGECSGKY